MPQLQSGVSAHPSNARPRPPALVHACGALTAAALFLVTADPALAAPLSVDGELGYAADDNVTRAARAHEILEDRFATLAAGVVWRQPFARHLRAVTRAFARYEGYEDFSELSNVAGGAALNLQFRPSGTLLAPTFALFGKAQIADYGSAMRDGYLYSWGVSLEKPLTDRIVTSVTLAANERDSKSEVFDTGEVSAALNLDYQFTRRVATYLGYQYLDGDIVSTASPFWLAIINEATAIQADDAFGGAAANRFAYRLEGETQLFTIGMNFSFDEHNAVDLSGRHAEAESDGGIRYKRTAVNLAYLLRF